MKNDFLPVEYLQEEEINDYYANKHSFFGRLALKFNDFINKIFYKEEKSKEQIDFSRFNRFVKEFEPDTKEYLFVEENAKLCDAALRVARKRITLSKKIKRMEETLKELECFNSLDDEEAKKLKDMLESFLSLTKERNILLYQLTSFESSVTYMENILDDAENVLPQFVEAEKNQRLFKYDISQLNGEKAALEDERISIENGISFMGMFAVGMVVAFSLVSLFLGYLFLIDERNIFMPTTVLVLLAMAVSVLVYTFRKRMEFELTLNAKKQKKLVAILNKKTAVLAHYTNFLNYVHTKYKITNSQALKTNMSEYEHYKHISRRIDSIRKIMYETESLIEKFLTEKNINNITNTLEQFAKTIDIEDKREFYKELLGRKNSAETELLSLDEQHVELWKKIEEGSKNDITETHVMADMVKIYFDDVTKMMDVAGDEQAEPKEGEEVVDLSVIERLSQVG
ncbi:MAG: hypothetical protein FWE29_03550 [Defluviitaleaceae bacterium]|nr:hypothetical protein [Defluviitaleaceae bacterium]